MSDYGTCPICERRVARRLDGEFRLHRNVAGEACETGSAGSRPITLDDLVSARLRRAADRCGVTVERALLDALNSYCTYVERTASPRPRSSAKGGWVLTLANEEPA